MYCSPYLVSYNFVRTWYVIPKWYEYGRSVYVRNLFNVQNRALEGRRSRVIYTRYQVYNSLPCESNWPNYTCTYLARVS